MAAQQLIDNAAHFLDEVCPLEQGSHTDVVSYLVYYQHVLVFLANGQQTGLKRPEQFVALTGHKEQPTALLFKVGEIHVALFFDQQGQVGERHPAHINDVQIETLLADPLTTAKQSIRFWLSLYEGVSNAHAQQQANYHGFTNQEGDDYCC